MLAAGDKPVAFLWLSDCIGYEKIEETAKEKVDYEDKKTWKKGSV